MEPERYVTWDVGAAELGMSKGVFFYEVRTGRIQEDANRPAQEGKYLWSSIMARKEERRRQKRRKPYTPRRPRAVYDWIRPADIPVVLKLDQERYGETADYEINYQEVAAYQAQYKKNPQIAMAAWSADRRECLGYISLIPLAEETALAVMAGRDEATLELEEIETYERPGGYVLLCRSVVARRDYSFVLTGILRQIMAYWLEQYPERYIARVYAQTASDEGVRLLRHLFLMPMAGYPDNAYYLDFARANPSHLVSDFLSQLQKKAPLPEELRTRYTPSLPAQPVKQIARAGPSPAPRPAQRSKSAPGPASAEMPAGLVGWRSFARAHNIGESTVQKAIESGRLQITPGEWKVDKTTIKGALDQAGRAQFYRRFRANEHWQNCPDCPHDSDQAEQRPMF